MEWMICNYAIEIQKGGLLKENHQQECFRKVLSRYKKPEKSLVRFDICLELCWRDEHHL